MTTPTKTLAEMRALSVGDVIAALDEMGRKMALENELTEVFGE